MYCNNCGKEILDTDKFCPFCGVPIKKKILIDGNVTPEIVEKRASILLEDGNFNDAADYYEALLDYEPENPNVYLGILLSQEGKRNINELINHLKDRHSSSYNVTHEVELPRNVQKHIDQMAEEFYIENFFDKNKIYDLYDKYNNGYISDADGIKADKESLLNELDNNKLISRIRSFGDKEINKHFEDLISDYDERIRKAKRKEKSTEEKILADYPEFINETDEKVRRMHDEAIAERESQYRTCIERYEKSEDIRELEDLCKKFSSMGGYEDADRYIDECKNKIEEIALKNKALQEEAERRKKKNIAIVVIAILALIGLYTLYINVIVPSNKYNSAMKMYEEGRYSEALPIFKELDSYKDSKNMTTLTMYHQGIELLNAKEYEKAVSVLEKVKNYEDASSKLDEAKYGFGNQLIEERKYDQALQIFESIKDFKDSQELIKKAKYGKGILLRENRKYDDSIVLFEELGEYEDSAEQKKISEKEKAENVVKIPYLIGGDLASTKKTLDKLGLVYTITESEKADMKVGTIISVTPSEGTELLRGSEVKLNVAKGLSKYNNYRSNGNSSILYQINITSSGNNIYIRYSPHVDSSNKTGEKAKSGETYNVYETVQNEGYTFVRVDSDKWFATDKNWVTKDPYCSDSSRCMNVKAWINDPDGSGVYDRPTENSNERQWVEKLEHGTEVTVYYFFNNGSHNWYKIGADRWVKDTYGEKVIFY